MDAGAHGAFSAAWWRELAHLRRSRFDLALVTIFPIAILALFGWLFAAGAIRGVPIAVVDQDDSAESRQLVRIVRDSPGVHVVAAPGELQAAWSLLRQRKAYAVLFIPPRASRAMWHDKNGKAFVYYNASYLTAGQSASRDLGAAIGVFNQKLIGEQVALRKGPGSIVGPPVSVQATLLFNAARSFRHFLMSVLIPSILGLTCAVAVAGALGRMHEAQEPSTADKSRFATIAGTLAPCLLLFTLYGVAGDAYLALADGRGPAGSAWLLVLGHLLLECTGAAFCLLVFGATRDAGSVLSAVGLCIGTAMAFSGVTFTAIDAPLFTRTWNALLPLTAYAQLHAQQFDVGAPWQASLPAIARLLLLTLVPGIPGYFLYRRALSRQGVA